MVFNGRLLIFEERNHMNLEELLLFDFNGKSEHFAKYLTQTPVVSNDVPFANFMFSTRNYIVLCSMDKETGCAITKEKSLSEKRNFFQNRCTFWDNLRIFISTSTEKNIFLSHFIYQGHAGTTHLVRPLYHLLIFNVRPTPAELSARPLQRVDFIEKFSTRFFKFYLKL